MPTGIYCGKCKRLILEVKRGFLNSVEVERFVRRKIGARCPFCGKSFAGKTVKVELWTWEK